jgi:hypothetical protein
MVERAPPRLFLTVGIAAGPRTING